jgi:hypothetical protein
MPYRQDNFITHRPRFFLALMLVLLGTVVHRETLDLANSLGTESFELLNLFQGIELPATLTTLIAAKVIVFLFLWGFLEVFHQLERPIGGLIGAFLLSLHPLFASNSGRFAIFMGVLAIFWWVCHLSRFMKSSGFLFPVLIAVIGGVVLSPWMLVLASLTPLVIQRKIWPSNSSRLGVGIVLLICVLIAIGILSLHELEDWQGAILAKEQSSWLKNFLLVGQTVHFIYLWGALVLFCFGTGIGTLFFPDIITGFLVSASLALGFIRLDLGGLIMLWMILCTLVGLAFDVSWQYMTKLRNILLPNLLVLILTISMFNCYRENTVYELMKAPKTYRTEFQHNCGEYVPSLDSSEKELFMVDPENSEGKICWAALGNYHYCLPGKYRATFYVCQFGSSHSFVDISQKAGKIALASNPVPTVDLISGCQPLPGVVLKYNISPYQHSPVEHRVYYGGEGVTYFDRVEVEALP